MTIETSKTEKQREKKRLKKRTPKQNRISKNYGTTIKKCNICILGIPEGEEREKRTEGIFEAKND